MSEILEVFFNLAAGWPLMIIGSIGLVAGTLATVLSIGYLAIRQEWSSALPLAIALAVVVGVGVGIIPNGNLIGPLAAITALLLTIRAHWVRSADGREDWFDRAIMFVAILALIAISLPLGYFLYSSLTG